MSRNPDVLWRRLALIFLTITTLLRLCGLNAIELAPDEAYYWDWSRHLSLGYYDQGPMIAYVIRLTTTLFGTNEFGVRVGVCLASCGTLVCSYVLACRLFSARAGFITILLLGLTPLMAVGSQIATYDPLLVFFWALTLVALERALFQGHRSAWYIAGLAAGLGLLSKHTMVLMLPCLLLFLWFSQEHRYWLRRPEPYIAVLMMMMLYTGVLWWNAHHHMWTFGHLLFLTHKNSGRPLRRLGDFVGSQALLVGPVLFLGCLFAGMQPRQSAKQRFLFLMGFPILSFFCLLAFKSKVQANWAPFAWITPSILWAGMLDDAAVRGRAIVRPVSLAAVTSGLLTLLLLAPSLRAAIGVRLPPEADVSNTTFGWRALARHVQTLRQEMERSGHRVFLAGNGYQYIALMAFYLPDHPEAHDLFLHFRLTMYAASVETLKQHLGEDALFINAGEVDDADLRKIFTDVVWQPAFAIWRRPLYSQPIAYIHIAKCYGYRRYIGLQWASGG
jgi:4-amino-4-deoxy-L-arabinose transferase-like glycosyltransferase